MASAYATTPDTLQPTWFGYIRTTRDVCILVELVMSGTLQHIPRRPHERERAEIIKSGNIFIYEEAVSGVKRWTDGVNWSPSRVLGNFLIYREVEQGYPPEGSKKVALKNRVSRASKPTGVQRRRTPPSGLSSLPYQQYGLPNVPPGLGNTCPPGENELCYLEDRELLGSLTDSYPFVENGLIKKTISLMVRGVNHHVVSYYRPSHVRSGDLKTPSTEPRFAGIAPRDDLLRNSGLRVPLEQEEFKINENSEAYITQAQAHAQAQELYQQQQHQQHQQHACDQLYHPRSAQQSHGLPDHGLPTVGIPGMATYAQATFNIHANPSTTLHAAPSFPIRTPSSLSGSIHSLAQSSIDGIGGGHYQQSSPPDFFASDQESYAFSGGPSRHPSFAATQEAVYTPTQGSAFGPVHDTAYTAANSAYVATHNPGYLSSPAPAYPASRDYRQPSMSAASQGGYMQLLPGSSRPDPATTHRDIQGVGSLHVVPKTEPLDWSSDYPSNSQVSTANGRTRINHRTSQPLQRPGTQAGIEPTADYGLPELTHHPDSPNDLWPLTPQVDTARRHEWPRGGCFGVTAGALQRANSVISSNDNTELQQGMSFHEGLSDPFAELNLDEADIFGTQDSNMYMTNGHSGL